MTTADAPDLIDALPGVRMPVTEVTVTLSRMWLVPEPNRSRPPEDFRASQLNLILHFGLQTTTAEAQARFDTAIAFAKVYPCRILVLCPLGQERDDRLLDAKLYAECFLGEGLREMCCVEALILGYPTREAGYLTNQVSTWLEGDLPVYLWAHRVPAERVTENHYDFLQSCRRIVFDGAVELGALTSMAFPAPDRVVDLAEARSLPVRQALGQFLSAFSPAALVEGLQRVTVTGTDACGAEVEALANWCRHRLESCAAQAGVTLAATVVTETAADVPAMAMQWAYTSPDKYLDWKMQGDNEGSVRARFGEGEAAGPLAAYFLHPVKALSEALFFS